MTNRFLYPFLFFRSAMVTSVRLSAREALGIVGNPVEDFFAALFYYPGVALQLDADAADAAAASAAAPLAVNGVVEEGNYEVVQEGNNNPGFQSTELSTKFWIIKRTDHDA